jgi:hypothetical protein
MIEDSGLCLFIVVNWLIEEARGLRTSCNACLRASGTAIDVIDFNSFMLCELSSVS